MQVQPNTSVLPLLSSSLPALFAERTQEPREPEQLAYGHTARKWESWSVYLARFESPCEVENKDAHHGCTTQRQRNQPECFTPGQATRMLAGGLLTPTSQQESNPRCLLDVEMGDAEGGRRLQTLGTAREISGGITGLGMRTSGFSFWSIR